MLCMISIDVPGVAGNITCVRCSLWLAIIQSSLLEFWVPHKSFFVLLSVPGRNTSYTCVVEEVNLWCVLPLFNDSDIYESEKDGT